MGGAGPSVSEEDKIPGVEAAFHSQLGITYAGLGRKEEAIREGKKALELRQVFLAREDSLGGGRAGWVKDLAVIYTMVGEQDAAVDLLEYLLSIPSLVTIPVLRLDPTWPPLRNHPRFKKLLATSPPAPSP